MFDMTDDPPEMFFVGIFSSFKKAEQIVETMLKEVSGFRDYTCRYKINEKNVVGGKSETDSVGTLSRKGRRYHDEEKF